MDSKSRSSKVFIYIKDIISEAILGDESKYREENWNLNLAAKEPSNSKSYLAVGIDGRINYSSNNKNDMLLEYR